MECSAKEIHRRRRRRRIHEESATAAETDETNQISNLVSLLGPNPKRWFESRVANKTPLHHVSKLRKARPACTKFQSTVSSQQESLKTEKWKKEKSLWKVIVEGHNRDEEIIFIILTNILRYGKEVDFCVSKNINGKSGRVWNIDYVLKN